MTHSFTNDNGNRRIEKVGLGTAEFRYAGCELVNAYIGRVSSFLKIRINGQVVTLSGCESEIRAMMRAFGF